VHRRDQEVKGDARPATAELQREGDRYRLSTTTTPPFSTTFVFSMFQ
jgi:hypothetical protein